MEIQEALNLAQKLMLQYNLHDWKLDIDRAKRRAGLCSSRRKTIFLSQFYIQLNNEEDIRNTILHEIAHALVGCVEGHNQVWKRKAREIGCDAERLCGEGVVMPKGKHRGDCQGCKREVHQHRAPSKKRNYYCGQCGKDRGIIIWRSK